MRREDEDHVIALMRALGTPMTREKYLELAFLDPKHNPSAEEEADIPKRFQLVLADPKPYKPPHRNLSRPMSPGELAWRKQASADQKRDAILKRLDGPKLPPQNEWRCFGTLACSAQHAWREWRASFTGSAWPWPERAPDE